MPLRGIKGLTIICHVVASDISPVIYGWAKGLVYCQMPLRGIKGLTIICHIVASDISPVIYGWANGL